MVDNKLSLGLKLTRASDKFRKRTQYNDYYCYKGKTYKFIYGEIFATIMNAVKDGVLDEYEKCRNEFVLEEYFKETVRNNLLDIFLGFQISKEIIKELKSLYSDLILLKNIGSNNEHDIKEIIVRLRGDDYYKNLVQNCKLYVDYGVTNYDDYNSIFYTVKKINETYYDYQLHVSVDCYSIIDICLASLFIMSSANKYLHQCPKCGNLTLGGKLKVYCNTCRLNTITNKNILIRNDDKEYYQIYNRLYHRIKSKYSNDRVDTFNKFVSEWKNLKDRMLIMSEKEKQKVQEEFFAKWRNV